jgi:hypothetical protein
MYNNTADSDVNRLLGRVAIFISYRADIVAEVVVVNNARVLPKKLSKFLLTDLALIIVIFKCVAEISLIAGIEERLVLENKANEVLACHFTSPVASTYNV